MKNKKYCATIEGVLPDSIAEECGLFPGDIIRSVNGTPLRDIIDYRYLIDDEYVELEILPFDGGESYILEIEKSEDEDLGIVFTEPVFDSIRLCHNHCCFCFVDQMIPGQRGTLYIKDDDYRMSFLFGSYITLTNLNDHDIQRIKEQHLSPLYISVHATEPDTRKRLLGKGGEMPVLPVLKELSQAGIEFHGQIVLVPGINDGVILKKSIRDIASVSGFSSLAVVPVGLTKNKNPELNVVTPEHAINTIEIVDEFRKEFLKERGTSFVYCSDEFYLLSSRDIPETTYYEDYPQIENGVGIISSFRNDFYYAFNHCYSPKEESRIGLITGVHGEPGLRPILDSLNELKGLNVDAIVIPNRFFGDTVTVTGLLTAQDILAVLNRQDFPGEEYDLILLPDILLKDGESLFLDDITYAQFLQLSSVKIKKIETSGKALADEIKALLTEKGKRL